MKDFFPASVPAEALGLELLRGGNFNFYLFIRDDLTFTYSRLFIISFNQSFFCDGDLFSPRNVNFPATFAVGFSLNVLGSFLFY